jgi:hypothetical protein
MNYNILYKLLILSVIITLAACSGDDSDKNHNGEGSHEMSGKEHTGFKPSFGDFMLNIQIHHAKLYFAGSEGNWDIAAMEVANIKNNEDGIKKVCTDRPETMYLSMIKPAIDSVMNAIGSQSVENFKNSYIYLTNTCNSCHLATKHENIRIQVPEQPPFSNQIFKLK